VDHLRADNRQDEYSPFRYFLRKARARDPRTDLDLAHLAALWSEQGGRCALSGRSMELPRNGLEWERRTRDPWKPSLDRIEGRLGYTRGNVRFVTVIANLAKSGFSDADVIEFCRGVVELADGAPSTSLAPAGAARFVVVARPRLSSSMQGSSAASASLPRCRHMEFHHMVTSVSALPR